MGFRFRKSIKLGSIKLNFSKSGVSSTVGSGELVSLNVGSRGIFFNFRIPGTGISYREKLFKKTRRKKTKLKKQEIKSQSSTANYGTVKKHSVTSYRKNVNNKNEARMFIFLMITVIGFVFFVILLMLNIR